jgi:hypothetical protein
VSSYARLPDAEAPRSSITQEMRATIGHRRAPISRGAHFWRSVTQSRATLFAAETEKIARIRRFGLCSARVTKGERGSSGGEREALAAARC